MRRKRHRSDDSDRGNALLPHLERFLGAYAGEGVAEPEWNVPFSAFRWRDAPERGVNTLVSFGLGRHLFDGHRHELVLALRPTWDQTAISLVVSIGTYLLDRHLPLHVGETVSIPAPLDTCAEKLIVASGDDLVDGLGYCLEYEPPVEVLWLAPDGVADRYDLGHRR